MTKDMAVYIRQWRPKRRGVGDNHQEKEGRHMMQREIASVLGMTRSRESVAEIEAIRKLWRMPVLIRRAGIWNEFMDVWRSL